MPDIDIENMSDEDFMGMNSPPKKVEEEKEQEEDSSVGSKSEEEIELKAEGNSNDELESVDKNDIVADESSNDDKSSPDGTKEDTTENEDEKPNPLSDSDDAESKLPTKQKDDVKVEKTEDTTKPKTEVNVKVSEDKAEAVNYEALYKEVMKPFKANGKEISLHNPAEAIQLMQMGANYTKKLQQLQPSLKIVRMLENQGLLDENKLAFLIDLNKKNPEAIKKLVKDSGIDPMDMDTSVEPAYQAGDYKVSDQQMMFDNVLQDVGMSEVGQKTVVMINKEWDKASKEAIWKDPEILRVITSQREEGLYDQISDEVNRQRTMGYLTNVSFISAYQQVGQIMHKNGFLKSKNEVTTAPVQQQAPVANVQQQQPVRQVLDTKTASQKTTPNNGDRARAAAPVRTAAKATAAQDYNPLSMSDEEFEKTATLAKRV